ncbi:MAG: hypothetical protein LH471_11455 [Salinibacterium sp.]|nr:hypothetical protein [Salinibacterium sp.]
MMFDGPDRIGGPLFGAVRWLIEGLFSLFVLLVIIALLFILVRYLLVATKAAQIYVAKNSPAPVPLVVNAQPSPVVPTSPAAAASTVAPAAAKTTATGNSPARSAAKPPATPAP